MTINEFIKKIRREKNWTQQEMAAAFGVLQQNIQKLENAGTTIQKQWILFVKILTVCRELKIDPVQELNVRHVNQIERNVTTHAQQETDKEFGRTKPDSAERRKKKNIGVVSSRRSTRTSAGGDDEG